MVVLKDQHLETEMNQYWTERSKVIASKIEHRLKMKNDMNGKKMILKYAPQKECLHIF